MKDQYHPLYSNSECEKIIQGTYHGILVFSSEQSSPYGVPMNHAYFNGCFYFHCATSGKKIDYIRRNSNVAYIITKYYGSIEKYKSQKKCHGNWESVIAYGIAKILEEKEELTSAFKLFMKYYGDDRFKPSEKSLANTRAIVVEVNEMTARRELEKRNTEYFLWEKD